jgi:hypothetical protein
MRSPEVLGLKRFYRDKKLLIVNPISAYGAKHSRSNLSMSEVTLYFFPNSKHTLNNDTVLSHAIPYIQITLPSIPFYVYS